MQPFGGYAILAGSASNLFIKSNPSDGAAGLPKPQDAENEKLLWSLRIRAQCQHASDNNNVTSLTLRYRVDPSPSYINAAMVDNGTGMDVETLWDLVLYEPFESPLTLTTLAVFGRYLRLKIPYRDYGFPP